MDDPASSQSELLHRFLRSRRSIRRFQPGVLAPGVLARILETATHAPSAHNRQPWRFAVLTAAGTKERLADAMGHRFHTDLSTDAIPQAEIEMLVQRSKERIMQAPAVIVLCMDASEMDSYPDQKRRDAERVMAIQSTGLAGLQLQLAAQAEGLSSVWVCAPLFAPGEVGQALGLPDTWEAQAMFFLGFPAGNAKPKTLKPLSDVVKYI